MNAAVADRATTPADVFGEAFGVVPVIHTPATAQRALAIGAPAASLLQVAARYPFTELVYLGDDAPQAIRQPLRPDRRMRVISSTRELPADWRADVIAIAVPGLPDSVVAAARQLSGPETVVAIAVDRFGAGPIAKRLIERSWRTVIPYREWLPEPQLYLLASDQPLTRRRPVPGWTRRLSEGYLPALFRFPKDEYSALFGAKP